MSTTTKRRGEPETSERSAGGAREAPQGGRAPSWQPPGTWVFLPVGMSLGVLAGAVAGLAPGGIGLADATLGYGTAESVWDLTLRYLARTGRLTIFLPD